MTIRETTFRPPIIVKDFRMDAIRRAIDKFPYRKTTRMLTKGEYDITDDRWNNVTHDWRLKVRTDGTGILTIQPRDSASAITQIGVPDEIFEHTQILQRGSHQSVLLGSHRVAGRLESAIFKTLDYVPDEV